MADLNRRGFMRMAGAAASVAGAPAYQAERSFSIMSYGAVAGGNALCTEAIQRAIDACAESGGGRVLVPPGKFLSGGVVLKDRVNLQLREGAVLLGRPWVRDSPPPAPR
ncbi:MAG: twin-arginine translocation signal domain-containing protein, partial [Acidobacteria bacterium]|nr:twin-arginine translocation signal domain-containing protein [Acidobacteriota bacterium]